MIELWDVWNSVVVQRKKRWVIAGGNAILPPGRRIALLGKNHTHNTTLLNLLCGVERPEKGSVRRSGLVSFTLGGPSMLDASGTMRENAVYLGRVFGCDSGDIMAVVNQLSTVKPRRGKPLRVYDARERRELSLCFTLALQFDWYFVDEALPWSPPDKAELVRRTIATRFEEAGVIWAASDPAGLEAYCDAGLVLDRGDLTFYDRFADAAEAYRQSIVVKQKR